VLQHAFPVTTECRKSCVKCSSYSRYIRRVSNERLDSSRYLAAYVRMSREACTSQRWDNGRQTQLGGGGTRRWQWRPGSSVLPARRTTQPDVNVSASLWQLCMTVKYRDYARSKLRDYCSADECSDTIFSISLEKLCNKTIYTLPSTAWILKLVTYTSKRGLGRLLSNSNQLYGLLLPLFIRCLKG